MVSFVEAAEGAVAFPSIDQFPETAPGPYERQMGRYIVDLLAAVRGHVPDEESHARTAELAATPNRWSAGHALFDEIRSRFLAAERRRDDIRSGQYAFEESCCQAMYNATEPLDPFDSSSAFYVVAQAMALAKLLDLPLDAIARVFERHD